MYAVGARGEVVIEKGLRDRLGVGPGWGTIQSLVGNRIEIRFVPPGHDESLFGSLSAYARRPAPTDDEIEQAVGDAIAAEYLADDRGGEE